MEESCSCLGEYFWNWAGKCCDVDILERVDQHKKQVIAKRRRKPCHAHDDQIYHNLRLPQVINRGRRRDLLLNFLFLFKSIGSLANLFSLQEDFFVPFKRPSVDFGNRLKCLTSFVESPSTEKIAGWLRHEVQKGHTNALKDKANEDEPVRLSAHFPEVKHAKGIYNRSMAVP